jgi:hypothetical protein
MTSIRIMLTATWSGQEHQLSSLVELQNLRKSLRNENSGLLDEATQLTLDASWVCYDKADAEEVDDGSTHVGKAPRVRCIPLVPRTCVCARVCVCVRFCGMRKFAK